MKRLKKLAALVLAVVMVLSMGMTAFADNDASIVINGTKAGQKIEAYRMFKAVKTGMNDEGAATVDYTLETAFEDFFTSAAKYGCQNKTGAALSEAAVDYVSTIQRGDASGKVEFAKEVLAWIIKTIKTPSSVNALASVKVEAVGQDGPTTLSNLQYGMYVIYPYGASDTVNVTDSTNDEKSPAMIVTVADSTPKTINMKSTYPTVDKEIIEKPEGDPDYVIGASGNFELGIEIDDSWDGNHNMGIDSVTNPDAPGTYDVDTQAVTGSSKAGDFQVGDEVTFQLTATVPDMTGFTDYTFKFHDTLSSGLDFKSIVSVKVGDTVVNPSSDTDAGNPKYTPTLSQDGKELTIELNDFFNQYKDKVGQTITVIYTAVLNENAEVGMEPNTNEANVEFSNDPTSEGTGESEPDVVEVHTFDFTIFKYAKEEEGETGLANAQFELYTDEACTSAKQIELVKLDDNTWRVATEDDTTKTNTITTPSNGKVQIKGLASGTYYLKETVAPNGYHKLTAPIKVEIIPKYDETTGKLTSYAVRYTYNGTTAESASNAEGTSPEVKVENKDGTILPDTGGMGTVIFTVAGIALILGVGASFVISRKKRDAR